MKPVHFEESILVAAPAPFVWRLLADSTTWRTWWTHSLDARTADRKPLADGSQLTLLLRPSWAPLRFRARVEAATADRFLLWASQGAGLRVQHAWHLEARAGGTFVRQQLTLAGPGLWLLYGLGQVGPLRRMLRDNLRGMKKLAERMI